MGKVLKTEISIFSSMGKKTPWHW